MSASIIKYSLLFFPISSAGLGFWQLKRLEWKKALIANLEEKLSGEPIELMQIQSLNDIDEYRRVKSRGFFDQNPSHQIYLMPRNLVVNEEAILRGRTAHQSNIGANVITPFHVQGTDLRILVNRGWLPSKGAENLAECSHLGLGDTKPIELVGIFRKSDNRPRFGQNNDQSSNVWHVRDVDAMAKALNTAPILIDADQDRSRTQGPYGGQTQLNIRNEHLNYAITWFSLSLLSYVMWYTKYGKIKYFTSNRSWK